MNEGALIENAFMAKREIVGELRAIEKKLDELIEILRVLVDALHKEGRGERQNDPLPDHSPGR